jgi:quinol-cytochrome oxidoreductase complex cytochrome b subunit
VPLGDIAGDALGGVFRFIARILFEIVVEWLLRGTGAMILRLVRPRLVPGETVATLTGLGFWIALIALGLWIYRQTAP